MGGAEGTGRKGGLRVRERGEKRPKLLRWAEAAAHSAPSHTAETRLSRQALFRSQGHLGSLAPCLPTHRTPLGWGLFFTCPSWSAVPAIWALRLGAEHPSSTLWGRQVSSESCPLWGSAVRGRKGSGVQFLVSWTPQLFLSRGPCLRAGDRMEDTAASSPWEGVGTSADTPGLKRLKKEPKGLEGAKQFLRRL